jgi:hypothetical protein
MLVEARPAKAPFAFARFSSGQLIDELGADPLAHEDEVEPEGGLGYVSLLSFSLIASVDAQAPKTVGELLSEGYQIKGVSQGMGGRTVAMTLQLHDRAYVCEFQDSWNTQAQCAPLHNE